MRFPSPLLVGMLVFGGILVTAGCGAGGPVGPAEVNVLTGPRFWTGDPARPWADAVVVSEGRITAVIDRAEIAKAVAGGGSVRQLSGALALPGLTDAHGHVLGLGLAQRRVQLVGAQTLDETLARIEAYAKQHPDDAWILGRGWDQNDWPERAWPDADRLEQVVRGRPCALARIDGHAYWVNRTALAEAGIDGTTPSPHGGVIHKDASGRPTGILIDEAMNLVDRKIPAPSAREVREALTLAAERLLSVGLTGVHAMDVSSAEWDGLRALAKEGRFPLRVTGYATHGSDLERALFESKRPLEDGRLRLLGIKLYADGALGSRGARLLAPYQDEPRSQGLWVTDPAELKREAARQLAAGLQPAIHAIGDGANRAVLDAYEAAFAAAPQSAALRPRIEHVQLLAPDDIPRFGKSGIVASMQPTHATSDMPWAEDRVGPQRIAGAYAWRALADTGAHLAFGSDFPVESPDPLRGLYAAVTRQDDQGRPSDGWTPAQRLDLATALAAFTKGAAWAAHQEKDLGVLVPGAWCDLTILDRDVTAAPATELLQAKVTATVIGGQVVWPLARANTNTH